MSVVVHDHRDLGLLPPEAGIADTVRWAVAHAVLAPSLMNSQPWRFRARVDEHAGTATVELYLDRARVLPHLDPTSREAVLACGAALLNLRLALHGAGLGGRLQLCPDPLTPELLAVVDVHGPAREGSDDLELREAVPLRATCRTPFDLDPLDPTVMDHLVAEAAYEGALLATLDDEQAADARAAAADARRRLADDPGAGEDLALWTRSNLDDTPDGLPGWAHGQGLFASLEEPLRLRHGTSEVAAEEAARELHEPGQLVVIGSPGDDRAAVLRAGSGVQRVLLSATARGLAARFLDEALRFPDTRAALGRAAELDHPQCLLHLGHAAPVPATRRRPVADVLDLTHET